MAAQDKIAPRSAVGIENVDRLPRASSEQLRRIDLICTQFERSWNNTAASPKIETYVSAASKEDYPHLLESLIRSQLEMERESDNRTSVEEFLRRFPRDRGVVMRAFFDVAEVEKLDGLSMTDVLTHGSTLHSSDSAVSPSKLGHFEIQQELARGGMGIVYRARHVELDRQVALKIIRSGQLANDAEVARFRQEAMAAASLQHESIVTVFEVGSDQGFHYYSMPLIEGEDLATKISRGPLEARTIARMVRDIAQAVQFAHDHGVVHRDLKPRNILVSGEGKVHVLDFGLATFIDREQATIGDITKTGDLLGTPAYMSPEHVAGKADKLSDVYGLGAILYAGLCGRPPHQAATVIETIRQIVDCEPAAPKNINPLIPKDLETITLKLISKLPGHRYPTAAALADELTRFLEGRPIQARPIAPLEQMWRWAKRQPAIATLTAGVFLSLIAGLVATSWMYSIARRNELTAVQNADIASQTVKKYLTDIANNPDLKAVGMESLRRDLLRNAQQFYQQLEGQPTSSPKLEEDLANTQVQLARISSELGELVEADQYYDKALASFRRLSEAQPMSLDFTRSLADGLQSHSTLQKKQGLPYEAEAELREAEKIRRDLLQQTQLPKDRLSLASTLAEMGQQFDSPQRSVVQQQLFDEVAQLCDEVRGQLSGLQAEDSMTLLQIQDQVALNAQMRGNFEAATKWFEACKKSAVSMLESDPSNPSFLYSLARAHKGLNITYSRMQKFEEAEKEYRDGDAIFQRLCTDHPRVFDFEDGHAVLTFNHGTQLAIRSKLEEAELVLRQAYRLQNQLVSKQPESFETHNALGLFCSTLATVLTQRGQLDEAEIIVRKGLESMQVAKGLQPDNSAVIYFSAGLNNSLGNLCRTQGRDTAAIDAFQESAVACQKLFTEDPGKLPYAVLAATSLRNQAVALRIVNEPQRACDSALKGLALSKQLLASAPDSAEFKMLHATVQVALAHAYLSLDQLADAKLTADECHGTLTQLVATAQSPLRFQVPLAETRYILGNLAARQSEHDVAIDWFEQALAAQRLDFESKAKGHEVERQKSADELGKFLFARAQSLRALQRFEQSKVDCQEAISITEGRLAKAVELLRELNLVNE